MSKNIATAPIDKLLLSMEDMTKVFIKSVKPIATLNARIDKLERASTKAIGVMTQSRGMMMGFVADLDLLGGAFGRVKKFLENMLVPTKAVEKPLQRIAQSMSSWSNLFESIRAPIKHQKALNKSFQEHSSTVKSAAEMENMRFSILKKGMDFSKQIIGKPPSMKEQGFWYEAPGTIDTKALDLAPSLGFMTPYLQKDIWTPELEVEKPASEQDRLSLKRGMKPLTELKKFFLGTEEIYQYLQEFTPSPKQFTGLSPYKKPEREPGKVSILGPEGRTRKTFKFFNQEVMSPLKQVMSGGIGLGFQTQLIMGMMQAFSNLWTIFQPVIDVIGILVESIGVAFMPIVEALLKALTSPEMLNLIGLLTSALMKIMNALAPLIPVFVTLIEIALLPVIFVVQLLAAVLEPLQPIFDILGGLFANLSLVLKPLTPILELIANVIGFLIRMALLPFLWAIYGVGVVIAGIIDFFSFGLAGAIKGWNNLMLPLINSMTSGSTAQSTITSYQTGTDYVPYTGIYKLEVGEAVLTPEENRRRSQSTIVNIYIDGGVWTQSVDELATTIGRKLQLILG